MTEANILSWQVAVPTSMERNSIIDLLCKDGALPVTRVTTPLLAIPLQETKDTALQATALQEDKITSSCCC